MKILQVCSYLYPAMSYGGPAKVVYELSRELSQHHQVTIYTSDVWDQERRIKAQEKLKSSSALKVKYFNNWWNRAAYQYRFFSAFGMVGQYLREFKQFEVLHLHDVFIVPHLLIGLLARLFHRSYVVSPHGVLDPVRREHKSLLKMIVYSLLARPVLMAATYVIATSEVEARQLRKIGCAKVVVVWNGIAGDRSRPTNRYHFDHQKKILLYVGKLHPQKGLVELVRAAADFPDQLQLVIAGPDDGIKSKLDQLISQQRISNVQFLGLVNEKEKAELYQKSDVFVLPSYNEGFSVSLLEAMNAGLPVLITTGCNFPDVIKYNAGQVVPVKNLQSQLKQALSRLIADRVNLVSQGQNASRLVKRQYLVKTMAKRMVQVYEQSLSV